MFQPVFTLLLHTCLAVALLLSASSVDAKTDTPLGWDTMVCLDLTDGDDVPDESTLPTGTRAPFPLTLVSLKNREPDLVGLTKATPGLPDATGPPRF